jgi:hypothetical protein
MIAVGRIEIEDRETDSPKALMEMRNLYPRFESLPHRQISRFASEFGWFSRATGIARLAFGSSRLGTNPCCAIDQCARSSGTPPLA